MCGVDYAGWADYDEFTMIWETSYDRNNELWSVVLTLFQKNDCGLFKKFQEKHREKDYEPDLITGLLEKSGFTLLCLHPTYTFDQVNGNEQKLTFVAAKL
ncbi:MAG: hypothetical protein SCJ97_02895 [Bacillota bacterium]|nr:hypothetical protein [Bacillota bacterium]